ncbi:antibiotic biosynthesis monooxygenase family protein [Mangrovibacterium lignilyticum]|uniref:antibiotic biosynthesis monooxygenase family protein n=1 Tax=Mangrovibacterium lignilyticum TaxID=2668052 RepID=UPI0019671442|nr:antibiotic biosynthesis monooxygenase [Mangrovibacterium lignilyticum]
MKFMLAKTPQPPYYAVVFSSVRTSVDDGYVEMAERMVELAEQQEGFLGVESARNILGITVSYWQNLESIEKWHRNVEHRLAQQYGREKWYAAFKTRIALVEREHGFEK